LSGKPCMRGLRIGGRSAAEVLAVPPPGVRPAEWPQEPVQQVQQA
jgi:hypothetical protein